MGTKGAAIATVAAQVVSVVISFFLICRKELPFEINRKCLRVHPMYLGRMLRLGAPIALQDLLVSISFLMILAIVNSMGVIASAGVGVAAAADYLKSYAIDCLFTAIFFCYVGYYNGIGKTSFVMLQGIAGALLVRVPVSYLMSRTKGATLFRIGLATPISSVLQLVLCLGYMCVLSSHDTFGENGNCRAESEDE